MTKTLKITVGLAGALLLTACGGAGSQLPGLSGSDYNLPGSDYNTGNQGGSGFAEFGVGGGGGLGRIIKDDPTYDGGYQSGHDVEDMIAGIWVDGNGCEHWIIDDGIEGYMSPRWGADGRPFCPAGNTPYTTKGFNRTRFFASSITTNDGIQPNFGSNAQ